MKRRTFLWIAGVIGLAPARALAELVGGPGAEWARDTVTVQVYADPRFTPIVANQYATIYGSHPQMPNFVIQQKPQKACSKIKLSDLSNGIIAICSIPSGSSTTLLTVVDGEIRKAKMQLSDNDLNSPGYAENAVCHEMMHSVTAVNDCYDCAADSCIFGHLLAPGPYDFLKITQVYNGSRH